MIDFHNHILPNIDDGADSIEVSLEMLREAERQGITDIVNTTHYKHPKMLGKEVSYEQIKEEINKLQLLLDENYISIKLHMGAETFFYDNIIELKNNKLVTFSNGKYMLIEFMPNYFPKNQRHVLYELKMAGITPIIAHPERYRAVQDNIEIITEWLESGCLIQVDAGSPIGLLGESSRITSEIIIRNKWCQIIGSDAHNNKNRNFCLYKSLEYIYKLIGEEANKLVMDNPLSVISGEDIIVDINYDDLVEKNFLDSIREKISFKNLL